MLLWVASVSVPGLFPRRSTVVTSREAADHCNTTMKSIDRSFTCLKGGVIHDLAFMLCLSCSICLHRGSAICTQDLNEPTTQDSE